MLLLCPSYSHFFFVQETLFPDCVVNCMRVLCVFISVVGVLWFDFVQPSAIVAESDGSPLRTREGKALVLPVDGHAVWALLNAVIRIAPTGTCLVMITFGHSSCLAACPVAGRNRRSEWLYLFPSHLDWKDSAWHAERITREIVGLLCPACAFFCCHCFIFALVCLFLVLF